MEHKPKTCLYTTENILGSHPLPAHSGPELCALIPEPAIAKELAREVVLDRLQVVPSQCSVSGFTGDVRFGLKLSPR